MLPTITGSIPHPLGRPPGCAFHPRCPDAMPALCDRRAPALRVVEREQVANPVQPPSGCYFHPRCPFVVERCVRSRRRCAR